jgi:hypothetical protein
MGDELAAKSVDTIRIAARPGGLFLIRSDE